ncbi:unnamed protein product, partial [Oppiella nova]
MQYNKYSMNSYRKYGRIYGSYLFCNKWLMINDAKLIRDIMVKDFHIFPNRYDMNLGVSPLQKMLFFMKGDDHWKRIRAIVSPAFTTGKLRSMMDSISGIADRFVTNLDTFARNGQTVDIREYMGAFAMDVISACAYGVNVESINNPNHPIVVNARKMLSVDSSVSNILSILVPPIARLFRLDPMDREAINYFDKLTNDIVAERKHAIKTFQFIAKKITDFIQLMIDNEKSVTNLDINSNPSTDHKTVADHMLTSDELTAQGILFFIAGYDTTSASLSHAIYYLSQYRDCQQKLYEELRSTICRNTGIVSKNYTQSWRQWTKTS